MLAAVIIDHSRFLTHGLSRIWPANCKASLGGTPADLAERLASRSVLRTRRMSETIPGDVELHTARRFVRCAIVVATLVFSMATSALAVDIEQVHWGFDGQIVGNRFNPLSILVSNPTPDETEITLKVRRMMGGYRPLGATIEETVFVSPYTSRWVQLYPFCLDSWEEWVLTWGDGEDEQTTLPKAGFGASAVVILDEPDSLLQVGGSVKHLPENLFPPFLTATDSLQAVFCDHVPRWEQSRREAFLDWLRQGGEVHILQGADGRYPEFPAIFGELGRSSDRFSVAAGHVVRHAFKRASLTPETMASIVGVTADAGDPNAKGDTGTTGRTAQRKSQYDRSYYDGTYLVSDTFESLQSITLEQGILGSLRSMSRPQMNWIVIYVMSFAYLLVIFPGCYAVRRKFEDYRLILGVFCGAVVFFSVLLRLLGRHDYGESTRVRSVAVATYMGNSEFDVSQWSDAFVTQGDVYHIQHAGTGTLYSTCQELEVIKGTISNGADARFDVEIPPFSSVSFASRRKMQHGPMDVRIEDVFYAGGKLQSLALQPGPEFPQDVADVLVVDAGTLYAMKEENGQWKLKGTYGRVAGLLNDSTTRQLQPFFDPSFSDYRSEADVYKTLRTPLVIRGLGVIEPRELINYKLPNNRIRLLVLARMPETFHATGDQFRSQDGFVLFAQNLEKP